MHRHATLKVLVRFTVRSKRDAMHEKALCRRYDAAAWQDENGTRTASWVAADGTRTHVAWPAEDYSLSTTFAAKRADTRPIFLILKACYTSLHAPSIINFKT